LFSVGAKYFFFISAPSGYATFRFMVRYKYAAIKTLILHADLSIIGQYGDLVKKNHSTTSFSAIYEGPSRAPSTKKIHVGVLPFGRDEPPIKTAAASGESGKDVLFYGKIPRKIRSNLCGH
jgi:hypothetical protein